MEKNLKKMMTEGKALSASTKLRHLNAMVYSPNSVRIKI